MTRFCLRIRPNKMNLTRRNQTRNRNARASLLQGSVWGLLPAMAMCPLSSCPTKRTHMPRNSSLSDPETWFHQAPTGRIRNVNAT